MGNSLDDTIEGQRIVTYSLRPIIEDLIEFKFCPIILDLLTSQCTFLFFPIHLYLYFSLSLTFSFSVHHTFSLLNSRAQTYKVFYYGTEGVLINKLGIKLHNTNKHQRNL
jgi:hypothetical protein